MAQIYGNEIESIVKDYYDNSLQQLNRHIYINSNGEYEHDISNSILKKGDYFNTFITIYTIGVPNGVTLKLCDENSKPLYSPVDTNNNWITTQCFITVGETDIIQLPAQFNAQLSNHIPFPAGTYNWKLIFNGDEYYDGKELPLTVEIRDFKVWDILTPQIFPNEDVQVKIKTYSDTLYPSLYSLPDIFTTHASFDDSTGIITYPNSDLNDLTVGKHMQIINQSNNCFIDYEVKNPIKCGLSQISYKYNEPYTILRCEIQSECSLRFMNRYDTYQFIVDDNITYQAGGGSYDDLGFFRVSKSLRENSFIPGLHKVSCNAMLSNSNQYSCTSTFTVTTEDCSVNLSIDALNNIVATYLYDNTTPIPNATVYIKELDNNVIVYIGQTNTQGQIQMNYEQGRYQAIVKDNYTNEDLLYSNIFSIEDPYLNDITISNNNLITTYGFDTPINEINVNNNGDLILTLGAQTNNHINDVYIDENGNLFYRSE